MDKTWGVGLVAGSAVLVLLACALPWAYVAGSWRRGPELANLMLGLPRFDTPVSPWALGLAWYTIPSGALAALVTTTGSSPPRVRVIGVVGAAVTLVGVLVAGAWMLAVHLPRLGPGLPLAVLAALLTTVAAAGSTAAAHHRRKELP